VVLADPTWSIPIHYLADGATGTVHILPTAWVALGSPLRTVPLRPGDHILGSFADCAAAARASHAVVHEWAEDGSWQRGGRARVQGDWAWRWRGGPTLPSTCCSAAGAASCLCPKPFPFITHTSSDRGFLPAVSWRQDQA